MIGRLLRGLVGVDEAVLDEVPLDRRPLTLLSGTTLVTPVVAAVALADGLAAAGVGVVARLAIAALGFAIFLQIERTIVGFYVLARGGAPSGVVIVGAAQAVLLIPMGLIVAELLLMRMFRQEIEAEITAGGGAGPFGFADRLAALSELIGQSSSLAVLAWSVRLLIVVLMLAPMLIGLAMPVTRYEQARRRMSAVHAEEAEEQMNIRVEHARHERRVLLARLRAVELAERAEHDKEAEERAMQHESWLQEQVADLAERLLAEEPLVIERANQPSQRRKLEP